MGGFGRTKRKAEEMSAGGCDSWESMDGELMRQLLLEVAEDKELRADQKAAERSLSKQSENQPANLKFELHKAAGIGDRDEQKARDLVAQWHFNSRVLDGRAITRLDKLAEYISQVHGVAVTRDDIERFRSEAVSFVRRSLSDQDKAELVKEQLTMVLQGAMNDRTNVIALHDTLQAALQGRMEALRDQGIEISAAMAMKDCRSLLFYLQSQQKLSMEANDRLVAILSKLVDFGTTRDTETSINRILNQGAQDDKPLTMRALMTELWRGGQDVLPTRNNLQEVQHAETGEKIKRITDSTQRAAGLHEPGGGAFNPGIENHSPENLFDQGVRGFAEAGVDSREILQEVDEQRAEPDSRESDDRSASAGTVRPLFFIPD